MNQIITWTDEHGSGIRGLPKKVGQARFSRCTTEDSLPEDADVGDLALVENGSGGLPYVRMEDGWHRAGEVQVVNETEDEDLRTYDGTIVKVRQQTVRVDIKVAGLADEPVRRVAGTVAVEHRRPVHMADGEYRCLECGVETMDRELFDELGCGDEV